jgi:hypothetical protein
LSGAALKGIVTRAKPIRHLSGEGDAMDTPYHGITRVSNDARVIHITFTGK